MKVSRRDFSTSFAFSVIDKGLYVLAVADTTSGML